MEDAKFERSHSDSPLPEAGHDPQDPLRPEIDEENSTPNPPIGDAYQDMEVTDEKAEMPDQDDVEEAGLSDNESVLSELDDGQFDEFDAGDIAIENRPAQIIDDTNVNLIGVHKRKRTEADGELPKKKKKRADKPRRKKARGDDEVSGNEDSGTRKSRRSKKEGKVRERAPADEEEDANLTPEERRKRAFQRAMDEAVKPTSSRRRKKGDIDLDQMADAEIEEMRRRMAAAAEADNEGRKRGEPARHKLKLLPEVVALLNKNTLKDSIVDPEINLLEAVRFFLEPLSDGSLPAYDIQKGLFSALGKLPINKDSLVASGIGKVIMFYIKSKRPELVIKRQAERLFTDWTRPILRRTDDYRKKEFVQADFDPANAPVRSSKPVLSHAEKIRAQALEAPRAFQRARMEAGPTTYTVVPKSNVVFNENVKKGGGGGEDILRKIRARGGRSGR
ncbi:transcription factor IWS1 [Pleomassaria siparia CBS 279.74]|uniref:Transcription factor IWS1 n=1 Tax=Pleomassaria siparia CBS 279.74 TaxID=1314801 RepID=A0A6G1KEN9_9PLEO|nr:transcription factor IWS1 [Pleomassaria siparia CBS 279.74]